jgi:hypothetical protein
MVSGVVSEQDYVDAHGLHRRPVAIAVNGTMAAILVVGVALLLAGAKQWGLILWIGGIGGFIGEAIQARLYLPARVRKLYSQFRGIDAPVTYRWNSSTLSVQSRRGAGERAWSDILKVREDDRLFLLYATDHLFEVVPKAWFASPDQVAEFRALAKGQHETRRHD